jgi:cytochrome c oxidase subunit 2
MLCIGVVGVAILLPITLFLIPWWPTAASTQAHNDHTLYDVLLIATVPIFVLVVTVIGYSIWKFRMKPGEEEKDGPPIHGNTRLEVVWTALPAILILWMCGYSYRVLRSNEARRPNQEAAIPATSPRGRSRSGSPTRGPSVRWSRRRSTCPRAGRWSSSSARST